MDRKFLEGLNLEKDTVETIMSEYGKSIQKFKDELSQHEELADQLSKMAKEKETLNEELAALKGETDERQSTIDGLEKELSDAQLANLKTKIALDKGLPFHLADRLRGDDEMSLTKDAEEMAGLIKAQQPSDPLHTTEQQANPGNPYQEMLSSLNLKGDD